MLNILGKRISNNSLSESILIEIQNVLMKKIYGD